MDLPASARDRVADIRASHVRARLRIPGHFFKVICCKMCGQRWRCTQITWCDDVEAGRIKPAGWRP